MPMLSYSSSILANSVVSHSLRSSSETPTLQVRPSSIIYPRCRRNLIVILPLLPNYIGKLPVSFPRSVGTTPVFYNYLKGSRFVDAGQVLDDGSLKFGHQVCRCLFQSLPCFSSLLDMRE